MSAKYCAKGPALIPLEPVNGFYFRGDLDISKECLQPPKVHIIPQLGAELL